MTPNELADEMESAIERIEEVAAVYSGTIVAVQSGQVEESDGIRIGSALLDFRDLARASLTKLAGQGPREAHAAIVWSTFRLQIARLEMDAGELAYKVATGEDIQPADLTGFNGAILTAALLRAELKNLRTPSGEA